MANGDADDLLQYVPEFKVLICKKCCYAIQPTAVSRHLKELHKIYRSERQKLLDFASKLPLNTPKDVVLPRANHAPIEHLPVEQGFACNSPGCDHLSVTAKRMKRHWVLQHPDTSQSKILLRVALQTFFRGNCLRYFVVNDEHRVLDSPGTSETNSSDATLFQSQAAELSDVSLYNHYISSTSFTLLQRDESVDLWRVAIPEIAHEHKFVMHAILALAALHIAYLQPCRRDAFIDAAARHQNLGLPQYHDALDNISEYNCHAVFAFALILSIHAFASPHSSGSLLIVEAGESSGLRTWHREESLPEWMQISRGGCGLVSSLWANIKAGPMSPLIPRDFPPFQYSDNPYDRFLENLTELYQVRSAMASAEEEGELLTYQKALTNLRTTFSIPYSGHPHYNFLAACVVWPSLVPEHYLALLAERRPGALILLGYYCVLLKLADGLWYMKGHATALLSLIHSDIGPDLSHWLEWPLRMTESVEPGPSISGMTEQVRNELPVALPVMSLPGGPVRS